MAEDDVLERTSGGVDTGDIRTAEPPKTTAPSVPETPRLITPELGQQVKTAAEERLKTADVAQKKIAESEARTADILEHKIETQRPARQELIKSLDEQQRIIQANPPQPPAALPPRPKFRYNLNEVMGPPGSNKPMNQWMDMITQLAAISGRTPQERMLFAVTAFNGMIEGWAKGRQEDFQQKYNEWKDEVANIKDTETRRRQYIQDVLNNAKDSSDIKSLKLQLLGQEDGDRLLVEAAKQKAWVAIDKGSDEKWKTITDFTRNSESIQKVLDKQHVGALMDDPGIVAAANRFAHGFDATPGVGYRSGSAEREAVGTLAAEIMAREGISDADRLLMYQTKVIGGGVTARAGPAVERAELQRVENVLTTLRPFEEFTKGQLTVLAELASRQSRRFGIPVADALIIYGEARLRDDPDAALFLDQLQPTTNEIERIITTNAATNTLSVFAQKSGEKLISAGYSAGTIRAIRDLFANDFARRERSLVEEANRHRAPLGLPPEPLPDIPPLPPPAGGATAPRTVSTPEEAAKLPPGTLYTTPDGKTYRR